jgi:hypothetical protein
MSFVIYNIATTQTIRAKAYGKEYYETESAAKAGLTRLAKKGKVVAEECAISEIGNFRKNIEKYETVANLMSGKPVRQSVNTPLCCDPSSETYWSM